MLQKTHSAAGLVAAELVLVSQGVSFWSWEAAGAVLIGCMAGPLADVDKQGSTMAKLLFPVSALLRLLHVRHRTMTHSIVFILALMLLSLPLSPLYHAVFIAAYLSHPLIDLFNEQGVQLFWPLKAKVRLLPKFMAVDTGSTKETAIRWMLLGVSLWLPISTLSIPRML
ncbi:MULTISPECIES: metal-dependent hydrolase [unclassified Paenibacillus]|uniref:metal-dependent hydrolase n=1 Tax=unclassified Paenibacillus TaxID=185978 RepID=UPI001AE628E1|nr:MULTISPECIES: metal-dependent hydrolase [unclassified Paenibacillus]MBP1156711.1 inner membrane protein [Paenibacillus sp. PvP091]MBP1172551.1 inner membrane protein [Paenibacillus sp. PvR098]MBP2438931.1 inner membrane protein [Paenibacillus sp. PvP052]